MGSPNPRLLIVFSQRSCKETPGKSLGSIITHPPSRDATATAWGEGWVLVGCVGTEVGCVGVKVRCVVVGCVGVKVGCVGQRTPPQQHFRLKWEHLDPAGTTHQSSVTWQGLPSSCQANLFPAMSCRCWRHCCDQEANTGWWHTHQLSINRISSVTATLQLHQPTVAKITVTVL